MEIGEKMEKKCKCKKGDKDRDLNEKLATINSMMEQIYESHKIFCSEIRKDIGEIREILGRDEAEYWKRIGRGKQVIS